MNGLELRIALDDGKTVFGTMLMVCRNPRWAASLVGCGLDFVVIDNEHAPYSRSETADMIAALAASRLAPIVRVPSADPRDVAQILDAGAHGIMVPYCETASEVRAVVSAARYRPLKGELLQKVIETGSFTTRAQEKYLTNFNQHAVVIIGIESVPAVENLEAILEISGIDAVFVGPHDLSVSLGLPEQYDHPRVQNTFARILKTCDARNIPVAIWPLPLESARRWIKKGMRMVLYETDAMILQRTLTADIAALRKIR